MLCFILISLSCLSLIRAQEDETIPNDSKTQCVNNLVKWCENMQFPEQGTSGMSMVSTTYHDKSGYHRLLCVMDSDGTNCTRNGSPWFACSPANSLTYKGEILTSTSTDVDDGICEAANKVYNQLFLGSFSNNNATFPDFQTYMGTFYEEMAALQEQMMELQKRLSGNPFMGGGFWGGFDDGFFSLGRNNETANPNDNNSNDANQNNSNDVNQIEKE